MLHRSHFKAFVVLLANDRSCPSPNRYDCLPHYYRDVFHAMPTVFCHEGFGRSETQLVGGGFRSTGRACVDREVLYGQRFPWGACENCTFILHYCISSTVCTAVKEEANE